MSAQRRRGQVVRYWKTVSTTDRRGNTTKRADVEDGPHETTAAVIPQRSSRAEVPGQQQINVVRLILAPDLDGLDLWSRVEYNGSTWDCVDPPSYHHGTGRHTRHWSIDVRERP